MTEPRWMWRACNKCRQWFADNDLPEHWPICKIQAAPTERNTIA